jgi:GT2 family glycosyltransferase
MNSAYNLSNKPPVTIIISTRNRAESLIKTLESIFTLDYPALCLIVLDQSDEKLPQDVLARFEATGKFCYVYSSTRGLGAGHNAAIALAKTEFIAVTDDDCITPPGWIDEMVQAFKQDEKIGLVFGNVLPADYDPATGYIPVFEGATPTLLKGVSDRLIAGLGIGACLGLRRSAWLAAEGFDEMLGPGAPLGSLEDRDFAIRLLLRGYYIYHSPGFSVEHYGFRKNSDLKKLAFRDWFGFGSSFAKFLKCGDFALTPYMLGQMWFGQAVKPFFKQLVFKRRLRGVTPIWSFWVGFVVGLFARVDRPTHKFKVSNRQHQVSKINC